MFPPWASGTRAERTSRPAGATPTVPCMGSRGSSTSMSLSCAWNRAVRRVRSSCQIQTRSGSGGCSVAVVWVEVSAPKSGTVVDAAQSRAGSIDTKCTATVSPGSAPSMWKGPVCGLRNGNSQTSETRSFSERTRPAKQSSVYRSRTVPGAIRATGGAPPKVQAYSPGRGRTVRILGSVMVEWSLLTGGRGTGPARVRLCGRDGPGQPGTVPSWRWPAGSDASRCTRAVSAMRSGCRRISRSSTTTPAVIQTPTTGPA